MQKARGQTSPIPKDQIGPPTACRRMISGTISLSVRSSFHLSLTVLVHYRSSVSIQPWEMVLPDSRWIPRVLRYLGTRSEESHHLSSTGLAPSVVSRSRTVRLSVTLVTLRPSLHSGPIESLYTRRTTHADFHAAGFRLFPVRSPLLRKSRFLSLPEATKMVQFASLARRNYVFISSCCGFTATGSPIRKSPDQQLCAPSRSLSQLAASFVAYRRQGIHHTPLLT